MFNQTLWIKVTKQGSYAEMLINVNNIVAIVEPRKIILVNGMEIDVEESYDKLIQMIANYGE